MTNKQQSFFRCGNCDWWKSCFGSFNFDSLGVCKYEPKPLAHNREATRGGRDATNCPCWKKDEKDKHKIESDTPQPWAVG